MARERYLVGVSEEELRPNPPPQQPQTPKGKWQNFWFYHKWHVLAGAAAILVAVILIVQAVTRPREDYHLTIVTTAYIPESAVELLEQDLAKAGKDLNGDGKVLVQVESLFLGNGQNKGQLEMANQTKFTAVLASGEDLFFAMTPDIYEQMQTALEGDCFFADLAVQAAGVSEDGSYWNWNGRELLQAEEMKGVPEDLYFGVRAIDESKEKRVKARDEVLELLRAYITGTPLTADT